MKKLLLAPLAMFAATAALAQTAPAPAELSVTSLKLKNGEPIAESHAYCKPDGKGKTENGGNINPGLRWSAGPAGTKSYALIMVDRDVPASFETANQEQKTIPDNFPRQNFYHWVLVDIPANIQEIPEGKASNGITVNGKPISMTEYGINGQNDYAKVFSGVYGGYDGPCPPWNDERLHRYYFIVYALDVPTLGLKNNFNGKQAEEAMQGHILAQGELMGTYTNRR